MVIAPMTSFLVSQDKIHPSKRALIISRELGCGTGVIDGYLI
ncbi:MAG: hypothetical protein PHI00_01225 [Atribacterota bacterium]|nr:hypothetical protein [Atribacterota bacterium]